MIARVREVRMAFLRGKPVRRLVTALALMMVTITGTNLFAAQFDNCTIADSRCTQEGGDGCYVVTAGCDWCEEDPNACWINFGSCAETHCGTCAGGCHFYYD